MPEQPQPETAIVTLKTAQGMKKMLVPKNLVTPTVNEQGIKQLIQKHHPELLEGMAAGGAGGSWDENDPIEKTGFGAGLKHGLNPFHQTPPNTPSIGDKFSDIGSDFLNAREAGAMAKAGNYKGAAGTVLGTVASFAGPEELKGAGKGLSAGKRIAGEALSKSGLSQAMTRAKATQKAMGGMLDAARGAEKLVQPIREALNAKFEPMHKSLEKFIVPMSAKAQQIVKRIIELEPESAKEISNFFRNTGQTSRKTATKAASDTLSKTSKVGTAKRVVKSGTSNVAANIEKQTNHAVRTALDYREADKAVSNLRKIQHTSPQLKELADEIDKGLDFVAHGAGKAAERDALKAHWGEMSQIRNGLLDSAQKKGLLKQALTAAGMHKTAAVMGKESKVVFDPATIKSAEELLAKIKGGPKGVAQLKTGQAMTKAGSAAKTANIGGRVATDTYEQAVPTQ
jgi:hypothetical protein